jgi:hypothetical protein
MDSVPFPLSAEALSQWRAVRGALPTVPTGATHPHGYLAASRHILAARAVVEALSHDGVDVIDVGGNPGVHHAALGERGHYLMPDLQPGDDRRFNKRPAGASICRDRFEACSHIALKPAYVFLFVHSAYYIEPMYLWTALNDPACRGAYVVGHVFEDVYGGVGSEASWECDGPVVRMRVAGNHHVYEHPHLPWVTGWVGPSGQTFQAEQVESFGGFHKLWYVRAAVGGVHRELEFGDVVTDPYLSGPVTVSRASRGVQGDDARVAEFYVDVDHLVKVGPTLVAFAGPLSSRVRVNIPVALIASGAAYVVNKPRTQQTYAELTHYLRSRAAGLRVPPARQAEVISAAVALAFVCNVEAETDLLYTLRERFGWSMGLHTVLVAWGRPRAWRFLWVAAALAALTVLALTLVAVEPGAARGATMAVMAVTGLPVLVCLACAWRGRHQRVAADFSNYRAGLRMSPPEATQHPVGSVPRDLENPPTSHIRPVNETGCGVVTRVEANNERDTPGLLLAGIYFPGVVPNVLRVSQDAEEAAIQHRINTIKREPHPSALVLFRETARSLRVTEHVSNDQNHFDEWVASLKQYNEDYRAKLRVSRREWQGRPAPDTVGTKAFLKLEKSSNTVTCVGQKATKPRLIQPPTDSEKSMLGPIVAQLAKSVRSMWDGVVSPIFYTSGVSTDVIGLRVDAFIASCGGEAAVEVRVLDQAVYDATLGIHLQAPVFDFYRRAGFSESDIDWLMRIRTRGVTPCGVKYEARRRFTLQVWESAGLEALCAAYKIRVFERTSEYVEVEDFQLLSGRMDTNLMGTLINGISILAVLRACQFLALVCGDDAIIFCAAADVETLDEVARFQTRLGLNPTPIAPAGRFEWEYCSKLFWFGRDPLTGATRTVLGPKPGRGLARMGHVLSLAGSLTIASAAEGMAIDAAHVPFLGPLARRTRDICAKLRLKRAGREWEGSRASRPYQNVPENWVLVALRYGLDQQSEAEFVEQLSAVTTLPWPLEWEPLMGMVAVDEA